MTDQGHIGNDRRRQPTITTFLDSDLPPELAIAEETPADSRRPRDGKLVSWVRYYLKSEIRGVGSRNSERAKIGDLENFIGFCQAEAPGGALSLWSKSLTQAFLEALRASLAVSTVRRHYATLSAFSTFIEDEGVFTRRSNPVRKVSVPRAEPSRPGGLQVLDRDGSLVMSGRPVFDLLAETARARVDAGPRSARARPLRDLSLLYLLFYSGLRIEEACSLTVGQIRPNKKTRGAWLDNVLSKGNKVRNVHIMKIPYGVLREYLSSTEHDGSVVYVFQLWSKKKLTQAAAYDALKDLAKEAVRTKHPPGSNIQINPHALRHQRAHTLLHEAALPESRVADMLGHSTTNYVRRYTKKHEDEEAMELKDI